MTTVGPRLARLFVEVMVRHLPPSASTLTAVDVGGNATPAMTELRPDVNAVYQAVDGDWTYPDHTIDAVTALHILSDADLKQALRVLRPGGRLIMMDVEGNPSASYVERLEGHGYTRILVERALDCPTEIGVLVRGEQPHIFTETHERIKQVAQRDVGTSQTLEDYRGRFVYLMVHQTPHKPVWARANDEPIRWDAIALNSEPQPILLGFSSLPRAVEFMQPAVLKGTIRDVHRLGKFTKAIVSQFPYAVRINPSSEILDGHSVQWVEIDPNLAEAPDE